MPPAEKDDGMVRDSLARIEAGQRRLEDQVSRIETEHSTRMAGMEISNATRDGRIDAINEKVSEDRKTRESTSNRLWGSLGILVGAVTSLFVGAWNLSTNDAHQNDQIAALKETVASLEKKK